MKSFTTLRNLYGTDTKNTNSANLTYGDETMNDFHRRLLSKADWPFLHRPRTLTTFDPTATFTGAATDLCTVASGTIPTFTGTEVTLTTTGTLPAGLSTSTTYYMVFQSASTFNLSTSLANSLAGTVVDITDTGSGTHTVSISSNFMQPLPFDVDQVESVSVVVGSTRYTPIPAPSRDFWDQLHYNTNTSDTPQYWFVHNQKFGLWPRPATDGNVITLNCKIRVPDLNVADYTTGNIDIVTNGSVEVTGSGTPNWTTPMVGRWLRITHSNTAASSGDGEWYEIASVESSTVLTLVRPYGGRSLTTGAAAAYTIGMMPSLPEAFHDLPEIYGAWRYWLKEKDTRADGFKELLTDGVSTLFTTYGVSDLSMILDSGDDSPMVNPNLTISL